MSRSTARFLVWLALAGQAVFIASWIVAGALEPGYSHLDEGVSLLCAKNAAHPLIVNAGLVVFGLSLAGLGPALLSVLPRRRAASFAAALFVAAGVTIILSGLFRVDCNLTADQHCRDLLRAGALSWHTDLHLWLGLVAQVLLLLTPFAIARALWPGPIVPLAIGAGVAGLVIALVAFVLFGVGGVPDGLVQRVGLGVIHLWVLIVAVGILHATRRERPPGRLVAVRPRDFFARTWTGEGELLVRPFFLWRRLAQRFEAHRQSTWISDRVWRIDDEAHFGGGRVQRRQIFGEFVADDRVHLTGSDLPEGVEVSLEEGGYRVVPFRVAFPFGPLRLPVRCHDVSHVESDGTLVNTFDVRSLGLGVLLARVIFRVRPLERDGEPGEEDAARAPTLA